jgi:hypothetical protein
MLPVGAISPSAAESGTAGDGDGLSFQQDGGDLPLLWQIFPVMGRDYSHSRKK